VGSETPRKGKVYEKLRGPGVAAVGRKFIDNAK
jgi:hypothetical protein